MSHPCHNDDVVDALETAFADTFRLMFKAQSYHWNVTGPLFHALHAMTEESYTDLFQALDDLGERLRALGVTAPCSLNEVMARSRFHDFEMLLSGPAMAQDLGQRHADMAESFRVLADMATGDVVTADMAIRRAEVHDKAAWMYRALVASEGTDV